MNKLDSTQKPQTGKKFSLLTYLFVVFVFSLPFQSFIFFFPQTNWAFQMLLVSMIMVTVGTLIADKYVFQDKFQYAGWSWGKPKHYLIAFALPIFLWLTPSLIELLLGIRMLPNSLDIFKTVTLFLLSFIITLIPAFGEEFGWRGYLLPHLLLKHSIKKALIIQAFVWWLWHLPVLIFAGINTPIIENNIFVSVIIVLIISILPSMMHAVIFAYFWSSSSSLAVVTIYHAAFDEIRDTIDSVVGLGFLAEVWQMFFLTIIGAILIWKSKWTKLRKMKSAIKKHHESHFLDNSVG